MHLSISQHLTRVQVVLENFRTISLKGEQNTDLLREALQTFLLHRSNLINRGRNSAATRLRSYALLFDHGRHRGPTISTILFERYVMRPNSSPLEHLTAFAIVFATGILAAASFVAYVERVRRNAVLYHCMRTNSEANLSASQDARRSIDG